MQKKKPSNMPVLHNTNHNNSRHNTNLPTPMQLINPANMFKTGLPNSIFNAGSDNSRSFMGTVVRKIYMRNANGEVIVMTDTHDFINTAEGMKAKMGDRKPRNKPRKKQFGNW